MTELDRVILMAIGKIKRQKQRPGLERLYSVLHRQGGEQFDSKEMLHQLLDDMVNRKLLSLINNPGGDSYRELNSAIAIVAINHPPRSRSSNVTLFENGLYIIIIITYITNLHIFFLAPNIQTPISKQSATEAAASPSLLSSKCKSSSTKSSTKSPKENNTNNNNTSFEDTIEFVLRKYCQPHSSPSQSLPTSQQQQTTCNNSLKLPPSPSSSSTSSPTLSLTKSSTITSKNFARKSLLLGNNNNNKDNKTKICGKCHLSDHDGKDELITCSVCGLSGHSQCLGCSEALLKRIKQFPNWECPNCKKCQLCGVHDDETNLICNQCDRGFHRNCLKITLSNSGELSNCLSLLFFRKYTYILRFTNKLYYIMFCLHFYLHIACF